jgi:multiple sugar transport system permease protein
MKRIVPALLLHLALAALAVVTLAPLAWMISASFMARGEASAFPPPFLPVRPTLAQYEALFTRIDFGRNLANSLLLASGITAVSLLVHAMAGYAFAKLRFRGRDRIFGFLMSAMVVPAQVAVLPLFLMMRALGLVNTFLGAALPAFTTIVGIFLVRQYALSIPQDLLDAARVDGASEARIFRSIVLPVLKPVLVTLGTITFLNAWNDFLWPLVILSDDEKYTLPVALASLVGEYSPDIELMMAGSVVTVLPILLLFLALQRYYIDGILMGGSKE